MADYSNFPFGDFTDAEVFALARESKEIGDDEFVKACIEAIRKRLTKRAPDLSSAIVFLLTTGDGSDGNEWGVQSIHSTFELAAIAKVKYEAPITRHDGSTYTRESQIEEWRVDEQ